MSCRFLSSILPLKFAAAFTSFIEKQLFGLSRRNIRRSKLYWGFRDNDHGSDATLSIRFLRTKSNRERKKIVGPTSFLKWWSQNIKKKSVAKAYFQPCSFSALVDPIEYLSF